MTEAEKAHYRNPEAQAALKRGLEDANAGRVKRMVREIIEEDRELLDRLADT